MAGGQRQRYLEDTYLCRVRTRVAARGEDGCGRWVALAENIFHPQGGGQPSDRGTLEGLPVEPRRGQTGHLILLYPLATSEGTSPFPVGSEVLAQVDESARRKHAALHTAGHLISGTLGELGFRFVASNHFPGQARVELQPPEAVDLDEMRMYLERRLDEAIAADLAVTAARSGEPRYVTIEGMAPDPCAGTHVPSLARLADLRIRSIRRKSGRLKVGYDVDHRDGAR